MDARLAERMVRKWQAAKARALGPTHDMAALPEVHLLYQLSQIFIVQKSAHNLQPGDST